MASGSQHLAVQANLKSVEYAMSKQREKWLALYRDDAIVSDPVGVSMFDPVGDGHHGKEAIANFYDNVIASAATSMEVGVHRIGGPLSCAVPMVATNELGEGISIKVEMISVYHVDEQGLIKSLHAYWDWAKMEAELAEIFAQA